MTDKKFRPDKSEPPFVVNDEPSHEIRPAIPEVVYLEDGFVPTVEQAKAKNIQVSPRDVVIASPNAKTESDAAFLKRVTSACQRAIEQAGQTVVGHRQVIEGLVIALLSRGHCLLSGPPGMGKTTIVTTLARLFGLDFRRISLTSDLTPSELTHVFTQQENGRQIPDGPLFGNVLLLEDINRASPKTQMTLLNAVRDEHVAAGHLRYPLPKPFFVVATETPLEREITSPLTASQRDRFMMTLAVGYPTFEEEIELACRATNLPPREITPLLSKGDLLRLQELVPRTPVGDDTTEFAVTMIRKTRVADHSETFEFVPMQVALGAGSRSLQALIRAAQARAILAGHAKTTKNDVRFVSKLVLRHRLVMQPDASLSPDEIIEHLD